MKRILSGVLYFAFAGCFAVSLASVAAAQSGACDYLIGGVGQGVTCYYRSQDDEYCYYTCYCTGTASQCNQFYVENGLS